MAYAGTAATISHAISSGAKKLSGPMWPRVLLKVELPELNCDARASIFHDIQSLSRKGWFNG
jgi:hypothetical protein